MPPLYLVASLRLVRLVRLLCLRRLMCLSCLRCLSCVGEWGGERAVEPQEGKGAREAHAAYRTQGAFGHT